MTPARCTVLAERAMPVADIDRAETEQELSDARDDIVDAKTDEDRQIAENRVAVAEAMLKVVEG